MCVCGWGHCHWVWLVGLPPEVDLPMACLQSMSPIFNQTLLLSTSCCTSSGMEKRHLEMKSLPWRNRLRNITMLTSFPMHVSGHCHWETAGTKLSFEREVNHQEKSLGTLPASGKGILGSGTCWASSTLWTSQQQLLPTHELSTTSGTSLNQSLLVGPTLSAEVQVLPGCHQCRHF